MAATRVCRAANTLVYKASEYLRIYPISFASYLRIIHPLDSNGGPAKWQSKTQSVFSPKVVDLILKGGVSKKADRAANDAATFAQPVHDRRIASIDLWILH